MENNMAVVQYSGFNLMVVANKSLEHLEKE
jgi:hypothetical protein